MALSILFGRKTAGKIGELQLDVTVNENHNYVSDVSSFPIEDGSVITDHVRKQPIRLSMNGFISNHPIKLIGAPASPVIRSSGNANRVEIARDYLIDLYNKSTLIDIIGTSLLTYTNMIMSSLSIPRDLQTGDSLRFSAEFIEIKKVQSEVVTVQNVSDLAGRAKNVENQGQNKTDTGNQSTKDAPKKTTQKAGILYKLVRGE